MKDLRIAVIGEGILGLCAASQLIGQGARVTIYTSEEEPIASKAATGISSLKGIKIPDKVLFSHKIEGERALKPLIQKLERETAQRIDCDFSGVYEPFVSLEAYAKLKKRIYHRRFMGGFQSEVLDFKRLLRCHEKKWLQYSAKSKYLGAFYYSEDGWFNPNHLLKALRSYLLKNEVSFVQNKIFAVKPKPKGVLVAGALGEFDFDEVVLACGAGMAKIIDRSQLTNLRLKNYPGVSLEADFSTSLDHSLVLKSGNKSAAYIGNKLYCGSADLPFTNNEGALKEASSQLFQVHEQLLSHQVSGHSLTCGVRVTGFDRHPYVGHLPFKDSARGVWVLTGAYKSGYALAQPLSSLLLRLMMGSQKEPNPYDPIRLKKVTI